MKKQWRLSASFISSFKSCPTRCYDKYVLGLVPVEDTDSQRVGTSWHKLLEIIRLKSGSICPDCQKPDGEYFIFDIKQEGVECPLCQDTGKLPTDMMDVVIRYLNQVYNIPPASKTIEEWAVERAILLYSLCGYNWRYSDDDFEVVAEEIKFRLPVRNPETNRALPNVTLDGKIDKIVRSPNGVYYIDEHKSTSKSVDSDSTLWKHLNLDTQTHLYPYAAQQLQLSGQLEKYGIKATDSLISGVRYDVWHKPGISPKKLTQADSAEFTKTGEYCGEKFKVGKAIIKDKHLDAEPNYIIEVNNESAEVEPGKKENTFAIKETPDMFGARLLQDISERPDFYFARREISRTAQDLKKFEYEIYNIYQTIKFMDRSNTWWTNESACEATFKCPYVDICYNNVDLSDGHVPDGFKKLEFVEKENE